MARMLGACFAFLLVFMLATAMPLFVELWMQRSLCHAIIRTVKQLCTGSFLMFIFQAKVIGFYFMNEFRIGGAKYVATGRGLPTERRPFVGKVRLEAFVLQVTFHHTEELDELLDDACRALENVLREAVAKVAKEGVRPSSVDVYVDRQSAFVQVQPPSGAKTIPMQARLTSPNLKKELLSRLQADSELSTALPDLLVGDLKINARHSWFLEEVGGLYLDYANITFYDGARLLIYVIFLICGGGLVQVSDLPTQTARIGYTFTFFAIGLVISSWLLAPFVFNPYMYALSQFQQDMKAWIGFFFQEHSRHWMDWNSENLKSKRGVTKTVLDPFFLTRFFTLAVCWALVEDKLMALVSIFDKTAFMQVHELHWMALLPPVFLSLIYCTLVTGLQYCMGWRKRRKQKQKTADSDDTVSSSSSSGSSLSSDDAEDGRSCLEKCPLFHPAVSAAMVALLELVEVFWIPGCTLVNYRWWKALILVFVLKYTCISILLTIVEGLVASKTFTKTSMLRLWLDSNGLFIDIFVSGLILVIQVPLVMLNLLNDRLCPSFNLHQLCLYRDTGLLQRERLPGEDYLEVESKPPKNRPAWVKQSESKV
jgi:hypothetical protein